MRHFRPCVSQTQIPLESLGVDPSTTCWVLMSVGHESNKAQTFAELTHRFRKKEPTRAIVISEKSDVTTIESFT